MWQGRRSERRTDGWQREWEVGKEDGKLGSPDHSETISGTLAWIFASNCHRVQRRVEREMASSFFSTTDSTADSIRGVLHVLGFHLPAFMCILEHHIWREGWWKWQILRPKNAKKNVLHPLEVFFFFFLQFIRVITQIGRWWLFSLMSSLQFFHDISSEHWIWSILSELKHN